MDSRQNIRDYYNSLASKRDFWKKKSKYYQSIIEDFMSFVIPPQKKVLEVGCGTGDLLVKVQPEYGVGIDISDKMVKIASKKYPKYKFLVQDAQQINIVDRFDYIIFSDLIGNLDDVQLSLNELHKVINERSRIIITYYNFLWEQILNIATFLGLKMPQPPQNWLSNTDINNLLNICNFEIVKQGSLLLIPFNIPFLSNFINNFIAKLPGIRRLCLVQYYIVRKNPNTYSDKEFSVSVIIPARNEAGTIEQAILRIPKLGSSTEIIFIEGGSTDNTLSQIKLMIKKYEHHKDIKLVNQYHSKGKGDAVRKGFAKAKNDILMILDADLTVDPEALSKFYNALRLNRGDLIMGSRLVYPMEKQAMRFLNILGNMFFSSAFTFLLDQKIKDTLCGTKVLFKTDYLQIIQNRKYFGDFDPFGDCDLIFGAAKLNLKILEIPIRYRSRTYGNTNISRFKHGLLLFKMMFFAAKKFKFHGK